MVWLIARDASQHSTKNLFTEPASCGKARLHAARQMGEEDNMTGSVEDFDSFISDIF